TSLRTSPAVEDPTVVVAVLVALICPSRTAAPAMEPLPCLPPGPGENSSRSGNGPRGIVRWQAGPDGSNPLGHGSPALASVVPVKAAPPEVASRVVPASSRVPLTTAPAGTVTVPGPSTRRRRTRYPRVPTVLRGLAVIQVKPPVAFPSSRTASKALSLP